MAIAETFRNLRREKGRESSGAGYKTVKVHEERPGFLRRMGKIEVKLLNGDATGGIILYPRRESRISAAKVLFGIGRK